MGNRTSEQFSDTHIFLGRLGGFRVVKLNESCQLGLICFADYIVSVNNYELDGSMSLGKALGYVIDDSCDLHVYNVLEDRVRKVTCQRSADGKFEVGATVRFEFIDEAIDRVVRVVSVKANFPAHQAGLMAGDYLIALSDGTLLKDLDPIYSILREALIPSSPGHVDIEVSAPQLSVYVYNENNHDLRLVTITARKVGDIYAIGAELEVYKAPDRVRTDTLSPYVYREKKIDACTQTDLSSTTTTTEELIALSGETLCPSPPIVESAN